MRSYAVLAPTFWTGPTGRAIRKLGPEVQVLALYLISAPTSNMSGLYYIPLPTLCHETGCPSEGASKALRSLVEVGFCEYDEATEHVWIPEMAKWQIGESLDPRDNRIKAILRTLKSLANSPFINRFLDKYAALFHLENVETLRRGSEAPSMPLRSQDQDQDQDQYLKTSCSELETNSEPEPVPLRGEPSAKSTRTESPPERDRDPDSGRDPDAPAPRAKPRRPRAPKRPTTHGAGAVVATIPLADGSEAPVTDDVVAEWSKVFPGVDVIAQLRRIRLYFQNKPRKRKTAAGIGQCIVGWLGREQDRGRSEFSSRGHPGATGRRGPPASATAATGRTTEFRDTLDENDRVVREQYDTETGATIRRFPHPFARQPDGAGNGP